MVNFYFKYVTEGKKLWTEVPKTWFEAVKLKLISEGYTLNEDGTVAKNS